MSRQHALLTLEHGANMSHWCTGAERVGIIERFDSGELRSKQKRHETCCSSLVLGTWGPQCEVAATGSLHITFLTLTSMFRGYVGVTVLRDIS